jgi:hypothetical protein
MKVLGAGFGKTGTFTLKIALEKLGFSPCYNFGDVLINYKKGDADMWNNFMEGKAGMDWQKIFAGYEAAVDAPSYLYYREIMQAFPDIKVILTTRDPETWWDSLLDTLQKHDAAVGPFRFLPSFNAFQRALENLGKVNPVDPPTKEAYIKMLLQHNENVRKFVPPDRLLEYEVSQGWEPLCEFLGVPVPDEPFPWVNKGFAEGEALIKKALLRDLVKFFLPYLAGITLVIVLLVLLLK